MKKILIIAALFIIPLGSLFAQSNDSSKMAAKPGMNNLVKSNASVNNGSSDANRPKLYTNVITLQNTGKAPLGTTNADTSVCHCHPNTGRAPLPQDTPEK